MTEDKTVVRLFFVKMKQAFLDLPEDQKVDYMRKDRENLDELGMRALSMIDCSWSNKKWDYIGVEEWPSLEALKKREHFESKQLEISKYVDSKTYIGTPESFENYGRG